MSPDRTSYTYPGAEVDNAKVDKAPVDVRCFNCGRALDPDELAAWVPAIGRAYHLHCAPREVKKQAAQLARSRQTP